MPALLALRCETGYDGKHGESWAGVSCGHLHLEQVDYRIMVEFAGFPCETESEMLRRSAVIRRGEERYAGHAEVCIGSLHFPCDSMEADKVRGQALAVEPSPLLSPPLQTAPCPPEFIHD